MTPIEARIYACKNYTDPEFDLKYYQEIICQDPSQIIWFISVVPGADIKYCQEHACKDPQFALYFAQEPYADIEYCQEHACKLPRAAFMFAKNVPGADIEYCRKACGRNKEWLDKFDKMIIRKAML